MSRCTLTASALSVVPIEGGSPRLPADRGKRANGHPRPRFIQLSILRPESTTGKARGAKATACPWPVRRVALTEDSKCGPDRARSATASLSRMSESLARGPVPVVPNWGECRLPFWVDLIFKSASQKNPLQFASSDDTRGALLAGRAAVGWVAVCTSRAIRLATDQSSTGRSGSVA